MNQDKPLAIKNKSSLDHYPFVEEKNHKTPKCELCMNKGSQKEKGKKYHIKYICLCEKNLDIFKILIERGLQLNQRNIFGETPLQNLIKRNTTTAEVEFFLNNGCDVNEEDNYQRNLVNIMSCEPVKEKSLALIEYLIEKGLDFNKADNKGKTALHNLLFRSNQMQNRAKKAVVLFFLKHFDGTNVNTVFEGKTIFGHFLSICYHHGQIDEIVQLFLQKGANPNQMGKNGSTLLNTFARSCSHITLKSVKLFHQYNGDFNKKDSGNQTAFHLLCKNYSTTNEAIKFCIEEGIGDIKVTNFAKANAFHMICDSHKDLGLIKLCLAKGADANQRDMYGNTPFSNYCHYSRIDIDVFKYFLDHNANINHTSSNYPTPIVHQLILSNPKTEIIKLCFEGGAKINDQDYNNNSTFHHICKQIKPTYDLIRLCIEMKGDINLRNRNNETPFFSLCQQHNKIDLKIIKYCLQNKAKLKCANRLGQTPFHYICLRSATIEILNLCDKYSHEALKQKDHEKNNAFHYLCRNSLNLDCVKFFLDQNFDIMETNNEKQSIFHLICKKNPTFEIMDIFFKNFVKNKRKSYRNVLNQTDSLSNTPTHYLFKNTNLNIQMIKLLFENGADIFKVNSLNQTPFHLLCQASSDFEAIQYLVTNTDLDINSRDDHNNTPFFYLCQQKNLDIRTLKFLLKKNIKGINLHQTNYYNHTPLHYLCSNQIKNLKYIRLFEKMNANFNFLDNYGNYPLHLLFHHNQNLDLFVSLLKSKLIDPYLKDDNDKTIFHFFCHKRNLNVDLIPFFLTLNISINQKDKFNQSPFHYFCFRNHNIDSIIYFLKMGAKLFENVNKKNQFDSLIKSFDYDLSKNKKNHIRSLPKYDFHGLKRDFQNYFERKEFTDYEIKGIQIHKDLLEYRTGKTIKEILEILEKYPKGVIGEFLQWVYYDKFPDRKIKYYELLKNHSNKNDNFEKKKKKKKKKIKKEIEIEIEIEIEKEKSKTNPKRKKKKKEKNKNKGKSNPEKKKKNEKDIKREIENEKEKEKTEKIKNKRKKKKEKKKKEEKEKEKEIEKEIEKEKEIGIGIEIEKEEENEEYYFEKIFSGLQISLFSLDFTLDNFLKQLYTNEPSKDFTIIINEKQKIKTHKIILQCRTGLYRGMFLTINDPGIKEIKDFSGKSLEYWEIILEYLYTQQIHTTTEKENIRGNER
ncbi:molting protein mlt-4 [Anaeramoeba flamelloides]|uniref:Molting protein mlt-4 n=1 Tax=Anaeramoeba flamelloides TaxID=1746091 RepID=A0ABQ8ZF62_9EUKA|nr:molting protein mlt-4 [Anaeramoeba flamelloides]